jgi:hypothetical protein
VALTVAKQKSVPQCAFCLQLIEINLTINAVRYLLPIFATVSALEACWSIKTNFVKSHG